MPAQPITPQIEPPPRLLRDPRLPIAIMVGMTVLLLATMASRLYLIDAQKAQRLLARQQARLAAEAGVHQLVARLRTMAESPVADMVGLIKNLSDTSEGRYRLLIGRPAWQSSDGNATSRITDVRVLPGLNNPRTPFVDESKRILVVAEGRSGSVRATAKAIVHVTDLARTYAVVNSLNRYYYGNPVRADIGWAGGLDGFIEKHLPLMARGALTPRGIIHDPQLLVDVYMPGRNDPLVATFPSVTNYGTRDYLRNGVSPAAGPIYCESPMIIDDCTFRAPVHTAGMLYRRGNAVARIEWNNESHPLRSSRRIQAATNLNEGGDPPEGVFIDADTAGQPTWLAPWHPDMAAIRALARREALYIDERGQAQLRGQPIEMDLHLRTGFVYSETYQGPLSPRAEQDTIQGPIVTLASAKKFGGKSNLDDPRLRDVHLIFSEAPVSIRGELSGGLVLVTPRRIFITGSTNTQGQFRLFLVAGEGVTLDTEDLESFVGRDPASPGTIQAGKWEVRAVLYKPGAGFTGKWAVPYREGQPPIYPFDASRGQRVSLKVIGSCLEGDLQRWLDHTLAPQALDPRLRLPGIQIVQDGDPLVGLPMRPWSINLARIQVQENAE